MDGVPGLTQDPIMPGESFTYEFTVRNSGSHMYHSHFDSANAGAQRAARRLHRARPGRARRSTLDYTMVLNDGPLGYTLNGKSFPATEPLVVQQGSRRSASAT